MPTIAQIVAAMPNDASELVAATNDEKLQEIFRNVSKRKVPTSSLRRLGAMSSLQAKIGLAFAAHVAHGWMQTPEQKEKSRAEAYLSVALQMLETMGYLRGAIMKVGQLTANFPDIAPDELTETLGRLHFQAPPMHFSLLREHLENELGGEIASLFAEFDTHAVAAASLGQVHRAKLHCGQEVAVKIQYPGIAQSIRADLRNLKAMLMPLRLGKSWTNMGKQLDELSAVLTAETDYELEAENLRRARLLFGEDDQILVPRVHEQFSTRRVLTMDWVAGKTLDQWTDSNPDQETRNHFGRLLVRAYSRMYYKLRTLYADPHPGNILLADDGQLGLIDFGCMRSFNAEEWDYLRQADMAMDAGREGAYEHMQRAFEMSDDDPRDQDLINAAIDWCLWVWKPNVTDSEFDFSDSEHFRVGIDAFQRISRRRPNSKPANLFMLRWQFAQHALHYRIGSRINIHEIVQAERRATGWAHRV